MSLAALLTQPLTIHHRSTTGVDVYGNETTGTTDTVDTTGYAEQTEAIEVTVDRETYVTNWLAVLPPGTVVNGNDWIVLAGHVLEVVGEPHILWNPRLGRYEQVECRCREVTGG